MQKSIPGSEDPKHTANVAGAVRALFVIYNNSRVYTTDHPVFLRTVNEHMSAFEAALKQGKELTLSFMKGQVRCGSILLDPGSTTFRTIAQTFEGLGISGLCIHPGITMEEIILFIKAITTSTDEIAKESLQKILTKEGVKHITERKVSLGIEGKHTTAPPGTKADKTPVIRKPAYSATKTFEIDDTGLDFTTALAESATSREIKADRQKPFRGFVSGALSSLSRNKALVAEVADMISTEYDERLNEKVEEFRQENKKITRRLESIKSAVFEKLESMHVMALLVDTNFNVLEMTLSAEKLIGNMRKIPQDSPLAQCVQQRKADQEIMLNGEKRIVHAIASENSGAGESVILLTLE